MLPLLTFHFTNLTHHTIHTQTLGCSGHSNYMATYLPPLNDVTPPHYDTTELAAAIISNDNYLNKI